MNENGEGTTRQERRAAARKAQILEAAAQVFAQKGYPRATTAGIAALADVSEGTIYNYFESKHDLLVGIMAELAGALDLEDPEDRGLADDSTAFLRQMLKGRRQFEDDNGAMLRVVLSEVMVDAHLAGHYYETLAAPQVARLQHHLQARIEQGELQPIDPALTSRLLSALLIGLFAQRVLGDPIVNDRWDELTAALVATLTSGLLLAPKAVRTSNGD